MTATVIDFMEKTRKKLPPYAQYMGKTIQIDNMAGEPNYVGRTGKVTLVDDKGQLHGTWGGLAVIPGEDAFHVVKGR
jgi:hypothetical protein